MRAALLATVLALVCATPAAAAPELVKVGDFDRPVHVASPAHDLRIYVVEQGGLVRLSDGSVAYDLRHLTAGGGERGLLSIAFAPDFQQTGRAYVFLTTPGLDYALQVVELPSQRVVLSIPHPTYGNHNGGQIAFGPDGYLYVATGDGGGGNDPDRNAQDLGSELGKILRIDARTGAAAPGNPFGTRVWAYGLRNPWRFSFDPGGRLVIGDVGQGAWEEVDVADRAGMNFGWPCREGAHDNPNGRCTLAPGASTDPVLERPRSAGACSIVGGFVVRDSELPSLLGRYLYGDFCDDSLRSVTLGAADDRAEPLAIPNLTSFGEGPCGHIFAASLDGPVYLIQEGGRTTCAVSTAVPDGLPPVTDPPNRSDTVAPGLSVQSRSDTVAPGLSVQTRGLRSAVRRRRIVLRIRCDEACRVIAGGRLRGVGRLRTARRDLAPGARATVALRMTRSTARSLRRALRLRGRVVVRLTVRASDLAGNSRTLARRAAVRR